jgi:hypothetical protein
MIHENHIDTRDPLGRFMLSVPDSQAVLSRDGRSFIFRTLAQSAEQHALLRDLGYRVAGAVGTLDGESRGICEGICEGTQCLITLAVKTFDEQKRIAALNRSQRWLEALASLPDPRS